MFISNQVRHQCAFVEVDYLKRIKFNNYSYALDYDFFLNLWRQKRPKVINKHISNFRLHDNLSANYFASLFDEMRVRIDHRIFSGETYKLLWDVLIFFLRYLKLKFKSIID